MSNFENPKWRTAAILKIILSPHLSRKSSEFHKFSIQTQTLPSRRKRVKNSEISKFKMADGRRIENHFLATTRCILSHEDAIWSKEAESHAYKWGQVIWSKCLITKIQNSGRQHLENGYTSLSEPRIVQIWRNMVQKRKFDIDEETWQIWNQYKKSKYNW